MGENRLVFAMVLVGLSGGTIELNDEISLSSEVGEGEVATPNGPFTMEFDEAHLEKGKGC